MTNTFRWLLKKIIRWVSTCFRNKHQRILKPSKVRRVAYYIAGGIGDAIMAYPAIRFLQRIFPDAQLTVFVPRGKYFLLSVLLSDLQVRQIQLSPAFILLYGLPGRRFDCAFTNTVAVYRVGVELAVFFTAGFRYGFRYPDEGLRDRVYTLSKVFSDTVHASEQNVQLVAEVNGIPYTEQDVRLPEVVRTTQSNGVIIHPGSEIGYENKRWPVERYRTLITRLAENAYSVSVLLGPAESDLADHFEAGDTVSVKIDPPVKELVALFKKAALFIGNDSGPAHIAALYGVPQIVLFGPVQPQRSGPTSPHCVSVYNAIDCSPCHFTSRGCEDNRCMQSITVEQVWREIEKLRHSMSRPDNQING